MRRGYRKASRQSSPGSLLSLQRTVKHSVYGIEREPKSIHCMDVRNGEEMMVTEAQAVVAVCNSWCTFDRKTSQSTVARALLAEGVTLANSKGFFSNPNVNPKRFGSQQPEREFEQLSTNLQNAISKARKVRCTIKLNGAGSYIVITPEAHTYTVRFDVNAGKFRCNCKAGSRSLSCYHLPKVTLFARGIQAMRAR
jgi:hypothetical protein